MGGTGSIGRLRIAIAALLVCLLWGGVGPALKVGVRDAPPIGFVGVRMLSAGLLSWAWARHRRASLDASMARATLAWTTLWFTLFSAFAALGFVFTTATRGTVFLYTQPFIVTVVARILPPHEPIDGWTIAGLIVAFAGILVIFADGLGGGTSLLLGDALVLAAAFFWSLQTVASKRAARAASATAITVWQTITAGLVLGVLSVALERPNHWNATPALAISAVYLVGPATVVAWTLWAYVLSQEDASVVSVFVFTVPVVGVFVSWLVLGEHVGRELLLGGGLVVLGIVFVHWPRPRTASRLPRPAP